jgi:prophage regulatory protein
MNRILRRPDVTSRTGLSRSTIYALMERGTFPKQVKLGSRAVGWLESEIEDWLRCRIELSRNRA